MGSGCSRASGEDGGVPEKPQNVKGDRNGVAGAGGKAASASGLKVIIAGAPASGKGTQCELIVEKYGLLHLSTGDLLREEVKQGTPAGRKAKEFMDRGDLVPDEVIVTMVRNRLQKPGVNERGWLLDGFPRAASQVDALRQANIEPDVFLLLEVPDEHIVERVVGRRLDPDTGKIYHLKFNPPPNEIVDRLVHRSDDTEEKCRNRLQVYHDNVNSVRDQYTSVLRKVDGARDKHAVFADIDKVLASFGRASPVKARPAAVQISHADSPAASPGSGAKLGRGVTPKHNPIRVIIAGAPASGKGTQCELIVEKFKLVHISTGDLLREEVKNGTANGLKAKEFMDRGDLVPDEVIVGMVKTRLAQPDCVQHGWLLDGFPRAESQALALEAANIRPDVFILLNVPDEAIVERVVGRRLDPETGKIYHLTFSPPPPEVAGRVIQRSDDTEDKCRNRLQVYHDNVNSIRTFYTALTHTVDGHRDKQEVFSDISGILEVQAKAVKHSAMRRAAQPLKVILCGAPASGKGTQSALLVQQYGLMHLSTGDLLREEVKNGTDIGQVAREYMDRGDLVPDQIIVKMVRKRLNEPDAKKKGWLLDGFPRTASQALALDANSIRPHVFLLLEVDEETLVERVVGRRHDPETGLVYHLKAHPPPPEIVGRLVQRTDDADEPTRQRLKVYNQNLASVRSKYESCLTVVNGNHPRDAVFSDICVVLDAIKHSLTAAGTVSPSKPRKAPLRVVLSGAPASGKGTQCDWITREFGMVHISAGDLLRLEVASQTDVGKLAQEFMDRGDLVPDELIIKMVTMRLAQPDCKEHGFLLDGFPLSNSQAVAIDSAGVRPHCYLSLNVEEETLKQRALNRRVDPVDKKVYNLLTRPPPPDIAGRVITRTDDTEETVVNRLKQYARYSDVIKAHYKDVLQEVDGNGPPEAIFQVIRAHLHEIQNKLAPPPQVGVGTGPLRVLIAGAPASGKGTQCNLIADRFGVMHFSAGDLLRDEVKRGTMVGRRAKSFIDNGDLVPDDTVVAIIRNRLSREDAKTKGWLLDGFPLNAAQAAALALAGIEPEIFIELQVPDDVLTKRVVGRRVDPETNRTYHLQLQPPPPEIADRLVQRPEDAEEKVAERLRKHHEHMEAVREKYKHIQVPIDGDRETMDVFEDIAGILEDLRPEQYEGDE